MLICAYVSLCVHVYARMYVDVYASVFVSPCLQNEKKKHLQQVMKRQFEWSVMGDNGSKPEEGRESQVN